MKRYVALGMALPLLLSPVSVYANQKDVISLPQTTKNYTIYDKDGNSLQVEFEHKRKEIQVVVFPPSHLEEKKVIVIPLKGKDRANDSGSDGDSDDKDDSTGVSNPPVGEKEGTPITYQDIEGHWAKPDITDMVNLELIQGYPDGTFRPNNPISRAEFAALLERVLENVGVEKEGEQTPTRFIDVPSTSWYYLSVNLLENRGNIPHDKYSTGLLHPNEPITREEMALWLAKEVSSDKPMPTFKDMAQIRFQEEVRNVTGAGLLLGYPDGTFKPQGNTTRAEAVTILMRFLRTRDVVN